MHIHTHIIQYTHIFMRKGDRHTQKYSMQATCLHNCEHLKSVGLGHEEIIKGIAWAGLNSQAWVETAVYRLHFFFLRKL